ncbi:unnamed protein product [Ixodes persulcatus]
MFGVDYSCVREVSSMIEGLAVFDDAQRSLSNFRTSFLCWRIRSEKPFPLPLWVARNTRPESGQSRPAFFFFCVI